MTKAPPSNAETTALHGSVRCVCKYHHQVGPSQSFFWPTKPAHLPYTKQFLINIISISSNLCMKINTLVIVNCPRRTIWNGEKDSRATLNNS